MFVIDFNPLTGIAIPRPPLEGEITSASPASTEQVLAWWKDLRAQRDKMLSTVVDIGMLARMHGNDALADECVGTDGLGGVAQQLRDLPGDPAFRATFETQPNRDAAELVARAWYVNLAASVSPELRNYFKEFI